MLNVADSSRRLKHNSSSHLVRLKSGVVEDVESQCYIEDQELNDNEFDS